MATTDIFRQAGTSSLVIHLDELANVLGKKPDTIKRTWRRMQKKLGMPPKHPAGWFWPRALFEAWLTGPAVIKAFNLNDNGKGLAPPADLHASRVADQQSALQKRYGGRT